MTIPKTVIVKIAKSGETVVEVDGCTGSSCADLTRALEDALGTTTHDEQKAEYHMEEQSDAHSQNL